AGAGADAFEGLGVEGGGGKQFGQRLGLWAMPRGGDGFAKGRARVGEGGGGRGVHGAKSLASLAGGIISFWGHHAVESLSFRHPGRTNNGRKRCRPNDR